MQNSNSPLRYLVIAVLIGGAFFGAYSFASARNGAPAGVAGDSGLVAATGVTQASTSAGSSGSGGAGCACCGSSAPTADGITGDKLEGAAKVDGDVQKIDVDLSQGYYSPNVIKLKAGVPAEITFGQGNSCAAQIVSEKLGFSVDTANGPQTVKLPALEKGEYAFNCSMQMIFGKIVVE